MIHKYLGNSTLINECYIADTLYTINFIILISLCNLPRTGKEKWSFTENLLIAIISRDLDIEEQAIVKSLYKWHWGHMTHHLDQATPLYTKGSKPEERCTPGHRAKKDQVEQGQSPFSNAGILFLDYSTMTGGVFLLSFPKAKVGCTIHLVHELIISYKADYSSL